jgi:hypothetical protein
MPTSVPNPSSNPPKPRAQRRRSSSTPDVRLCEPVSATYQTSLARRNGNWKNASRDWRLKHADLAPGRASLGARDSGDDP